MLAAILSCAGIPYFSKMFGPRSGPDRQNLDSLSLMVFQVECFEKGNSEGKKTADDTKSIKH